MCRFNLPRAVLTLGIALLALLPNLGRASTPTVNFQVGSYTNLPGKMVTAQVSVSGFTDVFVVQFSLQWDATILQYSGVGGFGLPGLGTANFGTPSTNVLTISWDVLMEDSVTVADGTVIFSMTNLVVGSAGSQSALVLTNQPSGQAVATASFPDGDAPCNWTNGWVKVASPPHACGSGETTLGYTLDPPNAAYLFYTNAYGLSLVEGLVTNNCTMTGTAYGPALPPSGTNVGAIQWHVVKGLPAGTTNLTIHAVKIISGSSATVNARVVDSCGTYSKQFDPVFAQLVVGEEGRVRQVYSGLLAAERFVRLDNGQPGLDRVKVVVNGRTFEVNPLGQAVVLDVRAAMNEGDQNTIAFFGWGEPGANAVLQIADRPNQTPLVLASKVEPPVLTITRERDQVVLSWLAPANFFTLESRTGLSGPWTPSPGPQEETDGLTRVRCAIQGLGSQLSTLNSQLLPTLFRLRQ